MVYLFTHISILSSICFAHAERNILQLSVVLERVVLVSVPLIPSHEIFSIIDILGPLLVILAQRLRSHKQGPLDQHHLCADPTLLEDLHGEVTAQLLEIASVEHLDGRKLADKHLCVVVDRGQLHLLLFLGEPSSGWVHHQGRLQDRHGRGLVDAVLDDQREHFEARLGRSH